MFFYILDKKFFNFSELDKFCHDDGMLGGHPERNKIPGVEASTGALGHGLSIGVGMALALKIRKKSSKVFVIVGDGENRLQNTSKMIDKHMYGLKYNMFYVYPDILCWTPAERGPLKRASLVS